MGRMVPYGAEAMLEVLNRPRSSVQHSGDLVCNRMVKVHIRKLPGYPGFAEETNSGLELMKSNTMMG
jgi:hypothetical protein